MHESCSGLFEDTSMQIQYISTGATQQQPQQQPQQQQPHTGKNLEIAGKHAQQV
jgi:hypothetical protein